MDALKRSIMYVCIAALLFGAGYWMGGQSVHGDWAGAGGTGEYIQTARDEAETAAGALESAGGAVDDAAGTAGNIEKTNQQLADGNGEIADLIGWGEQILAGIRSRGEEDP